MFCTNCGKELPEGANVCPYCGMEKLHIPGVDELQRSEMDLVEVPMPERVNSDSLAQQETGGEDEAKTWKDKLIEHVGTACAIVLFIGLCIGAKNWIQSHYGQHKLYTAMYASAVEEVEEIFDGASNLKTGDYDKDYVVFQDYGYYDFGHGRLRYAVYAVSVPTEWDAVAGHMDESTTIKVFYYTSDQNVSDGVDTSVPDHLEREDASQELNDIFNGLENLGNFDD